MKKFLVLGTGILMMLALLAGAFCLDAVRLTREAEAPVAVVDDELQSQENRFLQALSSWSAAPQTLKPLVESLAKASSRDVRHKEFNVLVAATNRALQDAARAGQTPPATINDNLAGAVNRRTVIDRQYQEKVAALRQFQQSFIGQVGTRLLGQTNE